MSERPETYRLKAMVVSGARISWEVPHAQERAKERGVPLFEAERVIRDGTVKKVEMGEDGYERWRITGWDSDARPVDVVVKPVGEHTLRVITVIRIDE